MAKLEHGLFVALAVICFAVCIGGVCLAVSSQNPATGGRGGAIAVALAFVALFITRSYGNRLQKLITETLPDLKKTAEEVAPPRKLSQSQSQDEKLIEPCDKAGDLARLIKPLEAKIEALENLNKGVAQRLKADADGQKVQNRYLAFSSVLGTIFWGFGDVFADWFI